jgi:geranylgeranyl pyrophosphate synthase
MDINVFLAKAKSEVENKLDSLIPKKSEQLHSPLLQAARYSLLAPAKRLRPLLILAVVESYGKPIDHALIPASAIEMIHTYSLIHDDLPCMDDDDLRRGKPTLHKVYPEWHALLTGDYLLTYAFEILSEAPFLNAEQKIALIRSIAFHAGAQGMIGGQMIDLLFEGQPVNWPILEQMHLGKTAGLIISALECGGIIAQAPDKDIACLKKAGNAVGIAFQLIDDILDTTGLEEELGKPIGSDRAKNKPTAVSILGIENAQSKAHLLLKTAQESLNALSHPSPLLHTLFEQMVNRHK